MVQQAQAVDQGNRQQQILKLNQEAGAVKELTKSLDQQLSTQPDWQEFKKDIDATLRSIDTNSLKPDFNLEQHQKELRLIRFGLNRAKKAVQPTAPQTALPTIGGFVPTIGPRDASGLMLLQGLSRIAQNPETLNELRDVITKGDSAALKQYLTKSFGEQNPIVQMSDMLHARLIQDPNQRKTVLGALDSLSNQGNSGPLAGVVTRAFAEVEAERNKPAQTWKQQLGSGVVDELKTLIQDREKAFMLATSLQYARSQGNSSAFKENLIRKFGQDSAAVKSSDLLFGLANSNQIYGLMNAVQTQNAETLGKILEEAMSKQSQQHGPGPLGRAIQSSMNGR